MLSYVSVSSKVLSNFIHKVYSSTFIFCPYCFLAETKLWKCSSNSFSNLRVEIRSSRISSVVWFTSTFALDALSLQLLWSNSQRIVIIYYLRNSRREQHCLERNHQEDFLPLTIVSVAFSMILLWLDNYMYFC